MSKVRIHILCLAEYDHGLTVHSLFLFRAIRHKY